MKLKEFERRDGTMTHEAIFFYLLNYLRALRRIDATWLKEQRMANLNILISSLLCGLALGCCAESPHYLHVESPRTPIATAPVATLEAECSVFLLSKDFSAISRAFDSLPPGQTLEIVLYRGLPVEDETGYVFSSQFDLQRGSISASAGADEIICKPAGIMEVRRSGNRMEMWEHNGTSMSMALHRDRAEFVFPYVTNLDGTPIENRASLRDLLLPQRDRGVGRTKGFTLRITKSPDCVVNSSKFGVSRGL